MSPSRKVQLGARVAADVRERALTQARAESMSLNEWVEKALRAALDQTVSTFPGPVVKPTPTQLALTDPPPEEGITVTHSRITAGGGIEIGPNDRGIPAGAIVYPDTRDSARFAPNCTAEIYHWKHGPGNPCRSCGGVA